MRLLVIQNGRVKDAAVRTLRDEYHKRFRRFGRLDIEERSPHAKRGLWPEQQVFRVLLDERGEQWTSPQLAQRLQRWTMEHGTVAFALGASHGHDDQTRTAADVSWSLSKLVLPHQLAHLLVIEQLYRAATILNNVDYHH
ncbi:MAG: 23S rRNA (pseudouridine(1915)-N(3))-methyltransferase RlmH [Planctomycetota bacterium]|jgi:23S rRNA (pseudouridine1915-N3)-methyltransferase